MEDWIYAEKATTRQLDRTTILDQIKTICEKAGVKEISYEQYKRLADDQNQKVPSHSTFRVYFKNFAEAAQIAGFIPFRVPQKYDRDRTIDEVKRFCDHVASEKDRTLLNFKKWSGRDVPWTWVTKGTDTWHGLLKELGISNGTGLWVTEKTPDAVILDAYEKVCIWAFNRSGARPTLKDFSDYCAKNTDGISYSSLVKRYGKYSDFCDNFFNYKQGVISLETLLLRSKPRPPRRTGVRAKIRFDILVRDNYTCQACGATAAEETLHIDHIIPVSQGGTDDYQNLRVLCARCNMGRGNRYAA